MGPRCFWLDPRINERGEHDNGYSISFEKQLNDVKHAFSCDHRVTLMDRFQDKDRWHQQRPHANELCFCSHHQRGVPFTNQILNQNWLLQSLLGYPSKRIHTPKRTQWIIIILVHTTQMEAVESRILYRRLTLMIWMLRIFLIFFLLLQII